MKQWTPDDIKSQEGKVVVITGGASGVGLESTLALARRGARVIISGTDSNQGIAAVKFIADQVPKADIAFEVMDLSDSESVRHFASHLLSELTCIDTLILNQEIAAPLKRKESSDGFEQTFASNYLGHFSLTALLFPLLAEVPDSRVVTVGSLEHLEAVVDFQDLQANEKYQSSQVYAQSKLALMLFTFELHRRSSERGLFLKSLSAHPGAVSSHKWLNLLSKKGLGQSSEHGAIPVLFAATSREARSGEYYGPDGFHEWWGKHPHKAQVAVQASNLTAAHRLWLESEELTGITFDFGSMGLSQHH